MTANDLKVDIISFISQITDLSTLTRIKNTIKQEVEQQPMSKQSIWKGAEVELRRGVTFDHLLLEQNYQGMSFEYFTDSANEDQWEISLDELLSYSN